jgi:hypothetical protein
MLDKEALSTPQWAKQKKRKDGRVAKRSTRPARIRSDIS